MNGQQALGKITQHNRARRLAPDRGITEAEYLRGLIEANHEECHPGAYRTCQQPLCRNAQDAWA